MQLSRRHFLALFAGAVFCDAAAPAWKEGMTDQDKTRWLRDAADGDAPLDARIQATEQLAASGDPSTIPELQRLLSRPRPDAVPELINWDPQGAERVLDLYIIRALHRLGDNSEDLRVINLLRDARPILRAPYGEVGNAVGTIEMLGRVDVVGGVVDLASSADAAAAANAVRALDRLSLPDSPLRQSLAALAWTERRLTFTITFLKEELEEIVSLSDEQVVLSPGTKDFAERHNYSRSTVTRQDRPLRDIIESDLPRLGFDYYRDGDRVVVCTTAEAAKRWLAWWRQHGSRLIYAKESGRFMLRNSP